jgi:hypothetical protein
VRNLRLELRIAAGARIQIAVPRIQLAAEQQVRNFYRRAWRELVWQLVGGNRGRDLGVAAAVAEREPAALADAGGRFERYTGEFLTQAERAIAVREFQFDVITQLAGRDGHSRSTALLDQ